MRERPKAIVFDLDETLIDHAPAWVYAVEEALVAITGRREKVRPLVAEYRQRPLRDVFGILTGSRQESERCEQLFVAMYGRSALKKLLVHEGVGMALDQIRGVRIEMAAITRLPHATAMRQIESTGLDRFFSVMSPTPAGEGWSVTARTKECLGYLGYEPSRCAFVSGVKGDLMEAAGMGLVAYEAGWATGEATGYPSIASATKLPGQFI